MFEFTGKVTGFQFLSDTVSSGTGTVEVFAALGTDAELKNFRFDFGTVRKLNVSTGAILGNSRNIISDGVILGDIAVSTTLGALIRVLQGEVHKVICRSNLAPGTHFYDGATNDCRITECTCHAAIAGHNVAMIEANGNEAVVQGNRIFDLNPSGGSTTVAISFAGNFNLCTGNWLKKDSGGSGTPTIDAVGTDGVLDNNMIQT
jgi:hypothetical protein